MPDLTRLEDFLARLGSVVLGYSGGVDSGLLAVVATRSLGPQRFLAVLGVSPSLAAAQRETALALARQYGVPLCQVRTRELEDPRYVANAPNRCFHCKMELWARVDAVARERGFDAVIDGTNADDLQDHRPGLAAAQRFGVRSPLAELAWTKADVRWAARELGLPVWQAPAAPCLASRIRYGLAVTPARLRQVEAGEAFLRGMGVRGNLRVRHHGTRARIEVDPDQFPLLDQCWTAVTMRFRALGFAEVERDPDGYRRGSLLPLAGTE
jgi:uncharacterized protein